MLRNTQRVIKKFYSSTPQVTEENINKAEDVAKHFEKFRSFYGIGFLFMTFSTSSAFYIGTQVNEFHKEKELRKEQLEKESELRNQAQHYQDMLHNHTYGLWSGLLNKDGTDVHPEKLKAKIEEKNK
eukprot:gb/GECH01010797.1/.p1 GENE.gb/GECH01010797.1/~~gb/GECH01010797.1/.p1  ORF type:complete len:127 (+),score=17.20 gb/GECH01010797.1/:1-381(+)